MTNGTLATGTMLCNLDGLVAMLPSRCAGAGQHPGRRYERGPYRCTDAGGEEARDDQKWNIAVADDMLAEGSLAPGFLLFKAEGCCPASAKVR
jgi:hypothetical protein